MKCVVIIFIFSIPSHPLIVNNSKSTWHDLHSRGHIRTDSGPVSTEMLLRTHDVNATCTASWITGEGRTKTDVAMTDYERRSGARYARVISRTRSGARNPSFLPAERRLLGIRVIIAGPRSLVIDKAPLSYRGKPLAAAVAAASHTSVVMMRRPRAGKVSPGHGTIALA